MSRVNTVREIKQKQQKEKGWDSRFYLERIPTYDAYSDPNCKKYQFNLINRSEYEFGKIKAEI